MNKKKVIIGAICITLLLVGIFSFTGKSSSGNMHLVTANASRNTITNTVTATGTVDPVKKIDVGTQVSGIINKIYVDFNSEVKEGQIIAEMDRVNLLADLRSKEADLASSKTEFEYQEKNYERSKSLHDKQLISDTDFETATYNYEKAKNNYTNNQSGMQKVRRNLEYATISSPIDGVVINRAVEEGQTVAAGFSTPTLFTIANDLTQMRVIANVDEADIGQVEKGQNVTFKVDAYPNDVFEGNVTQVRLEAKTTSNVVTYEVVISAHNPDLKLKPGLTAQVTIYTLEQNNVLTLPNKALRFIPDEPALQAMHILVAENIREVPAGKKVVWVNEGNKLNPRLITVGTSNFNITEIVDGLSENDEIAMDISAGMPNMPNGGPGGGSMFMPKPPGGKR